MTRNKRKDAQNKPSKESTNESSSSPEPGIVMGDKIHSGLLSKWPRLKMKVPAIFLHKTVDLVNHVRRMLTLGINFYHLESSTNYTRIFCQSFKDHSAMTQYFDKNELPYHTFGHPTKRKMKVVIRGLSKDTDLDKLKEALKLASIPLVRVHKMNVKNFDKAQNMLVLAVVPFNDEGKNILKIKEIFGHAVTFEPPETKTKQCHRCQKWGHSQRYCHGQVKCVKCAGDHFTKKCERDAENEPPTCANCGGNHTASYRECFCCPDSAEYKQKQAQKIKKQNPTSATSVRRLLCLDDLKCLNKKFSNILKDEEAALP